MKKSLGHGAEDNEPLLSKLRFKINCATNFRR